MDKIQILNLIAKSVLFIIISGLWLFMLFMLMVFLIIVSTLTHDIILSEDKWMLIPLIGAMLLTFLWVIRLLFETIPINLRKNK